MNVFFAVDDNYIYPFLVALYSAVKNSTVEHRYTLAFDAELLSQPSRQIAQQFAKEIGIALSFREIHMDNLPSAGHIAPTSYARIFILLEESEPFIWLDADILCLKAWDDFIDPSVEIIVAENNAYKKGERRKLVAGFARPEPREFDATCNNQAIIIQHSSYFNAGILLLNSFAWHEASNENIVRDLVINYRTLGFQWADQDILNYLVGKSEILTMYPLGATYNLDGSSPLINLMEDSKIWHFLGTQKPWLQLNGRFMRHFEDKRRKELFTYRIYAEYEEEIGLMLKMDNRIDLFDIFFALKSEAISRRWAVSKLLSKDGLKRLILAIDLLVLDGRAERLYQRVKFRKIHR